MYGLAVIEVMTLSGHLSNIDEIHKFKCVVKIRLTLFWNSDREKDALRSQYIYY